MKKPPIILALLTGLVILLLASATAVRGQGGMIVLENADSSRTVGLSGNSDLLTNISQTAARVNLEWANSARFITVSPIPADLSNHLEQVSNRVALEWANASLYRPLSFPAGISGDVQGPQISGLLIAFSGSSLTVSFNLNELGRASIGYGTASNTYSQTITSPLYLTHHELTLPNIQKKTLYYYRITVTDRSGNQNLMPEDTFIFRYVYLPLVID